TNEIRRLGLHLLFGAEDMRVILSKTTYPHDAVQRARWLIAVTGTELGQAQRQLAVALQTLVVHLNMTRAVHRLDRVIAAFRFSGKHVFGVVGPVPGLLPEHTVNDLRRANFLVAVLTLHLAHVLL